MTEPLSEDARRQDRSVDHRPRAERALVVHPEHGRKPGPRAPEARLEEAVGLARALDLEIVGEELAVLRATAPATLFGKGKVEQLGEAARALDVAVIVIDDALTPVQQRNLERLWGVKVVDRTGLILEIFGRRARTREGRLQVELARQQYERSRLVRTWTHLERQSGGGARTGGPGETQIELDRRQIADRIVKLKRELEDVRHTRALQREARQRAPHPVVALVGYTNAGKSTLFNRLTEANVMAENLLFATLDTTLRTVRLPGGRPAIASDTVGFISDLPHELVDAFRATLEEVKEADVILHVRDIAAPDSEAEADDVRKVLATLGIEPGEERLIEVWNKLDRLEVEAREQVEARARRSGAGDQALALPVSALTGDGIDALLQCLAERVDDSPVVEALLEPGEGRALAWLYAHGRVVARGEAGAGGTRIEVRLEPQALGRFERLFPDAVVRQANP